MRITALHNIREPGLIPNGFQREEAPAPSPDQAWQPELRIKAKAMTDTRHAVEYLNPSVHMEVNAGNRTSVLDRTSLAEGKEKESFHRGEKAEKAGEFDRRVAEYEKLLKDLWEKVKTAGSLSPAAAEDKEEPMPERARDVLSRLNRENLDRTTGRESAADEGRDMPSPENSTAAGAPSRLPQETQQPDYYFRRGVQAYSRHMQENIPENTVTFNNAL